MEMTVKEIFLKAGDAILNNDFETALSIYSQFIEQADDNVFIDDAIYNKGLVFFLKGDYEKAIEQFKIIIKDYPNGKIDSVGEIREVGYTAAKAYLGIGNSYFAMEEYDKAIDAYSKIEKYPESYTEIKYGDDKKREYFYAIALDKMIMIYGDKLKDSEQVNKCLDILQNKFPGSIFLKQRN